MMVKFLIILNILIFLMVGCTIGDNSDSGDKICSIDNPTGVCPTGQICEEGLCVDEVHLCSTEYPNGICPDTQVCEEGLCILEDNSCSIENPTGDCPDGEICENGVCVTEDNSCSVENPTGDCPEGEICENGVCVTEDNSCSVENPTGNCPEGEVCENGVCISEGVDLGDFGTFTGRWAQVQTLSAVTTSFGIDTDSVTKVYLLVDMVQNEDQTVTVQATTCDIDVDVISPLANTTIPTLFIEHVDPVETIYNYFEEDGKIIITQDQLLQVRGVILDDPENDTMPEDGDDSRVIDQDEDGNPGMTIQVTVMGISSGVYIAQRTKTELRGEILDSNSFGGDVIWADEQAVLGAEKQALNQPLSITPTLEESYFKTVKIDSSWGCEQILENKDNLFQ